MLLRAYALGIFPMAERRGDDEIYWVDPERRGVLPLDEFHLPRRLARTIRQARFEIRCDSAFDSVVEACAEPDFGRPRDLDQLADRAPQRPALRAGLCP